MLITTYAVNMYFYCILFLVTLPVFAALLRPHAAPVGSCFSYLRLRPLGAGPSSLLPTNKRFL